MLKAQIKGFLIGFFGFGSMAVLAAQSGAIVTDHYHEVVYLEPYEVKVCSEELYSTSSQEDIINNAFWGAIFGAVVGDVIDEDGGRVPGAIVGALIGAESAPTTEGNTTTAVVCKTETRKKKTVRNEYSHSTIEFNYAGNWYEIDFTKR